GGAREDSDDARRALGWAVPARPRGVESSGGGGLARPALRQATRADARVRRDRGPRLPPREGARLPRAVLPDPVRGSGRDGPRQAAEVDPARACGDPDLPGGGRSEERGARGRDRGRLDPDVLFSTVHEVVPGVARRGISRARRAAGAGRYHAVGRGRRRGPLTDGLRPLGPPPKPPPGEVAPAEPALEERLRHAVELRRRTMRLNGKVAVITGAGSGIGAASAIAMAREGARVVVADINEA